MTKLITFPQAQKVEDDDEVKVPENPANVVDDEDDDFDDDDDDDDDDDEDEDEVEPAV